MRLLILISLLASAAFAQTADTSNNSALHGAYFIREVYIYGQNSNGAITGPASAIGVITFDGGGNYSYADASGAAAVKGVYGVGSNGLLYIQSVLDGTQDAYGSIGAVGPSAFVASATENGNADIIVAIPAGSAISAASLNGNYSAGYVAFPNADVTQVREASFNFSRFKIGVEYVSITDPPDQTFQTNLAFQKQHDHVVKRRHSNVGYVKSRKRLGKVFPNQCRLITSFKNR